VLLNVRGSNGSGKTTVSQRLREEHRVLEEIIPPEMHGKRFKKPVVVPLEGGVCLLGRAQSGLDGIFPQEIIEDLIRECAVTYPHVVYENVLISGNIGRWGRLATELEPVNHSVWAHLDTPQQLCLDRIYQRRAVRAAEGWKHRGATIKEEVIRAHWRRVRRVAAQSVRYGLDVRWLPHETAYETVHDMLVRAGWDCPHGLLSPLTEPPRWAPSEEELAVLTKHCLLPWETEESAGIPPRAPRRGLERGPSLKVVVARGTVDPEPSALHDPYTDTGDLFG
jgi:hypothetical protein